MVTPPRSNRREEIYYDGEVYKGRHLVENKFADYKHFRGIAARYCKLAETFAGAFQLVTWYAQTREGWKRSSEHLEKLYPRELGKFATE